MKNEKMTIVVICTGNTCRSPMAEGIIKDTLKKDGVDNIVVYSMGLSAYDGEMASQYSIDALKEIGIDIADHRTKLVMKQDLIDADKIYVMTLQHKNVIVEACVEVEPKIIVMDVPDPFGQSYEKYCECRDHMLNFFKENPPIEKSDD